MKAYVSKPVPTYLSAKPMIRGEYYALRRWKLGREEDGNEGGYLVEHAVCRPGLPNHEDFEGYIDWMTTEYFEKDFVLINPENPG